MDKIFHILKGELIRVLKLNIDRKKNRKGPGMPTADLAVMKRATEDLAESMPDPGLEVGERAPDFELVNAFGDRVRLFDHLARGPVVLSFYRGAWCPYCNLQLRGLVKTLPHIEARGATLITIAPGNKHAATDLGPLTRQRRTRFAGQSFYFTGPQQFLVSTSVDDGYRFALVSRFRMP